MAWDHNISPWFWLSFCSGVGPEEAPPPMIKGYLLDQRARVLDDAAVVLAEQVGEEHPGRVEALVDVRVAVVERPEAEVAPEEAVDHVAEVERLLVGLRADVREQVLAQDAAELVHAVLARLGVRVLLLVVRQRKVVRQVLLRRPDRAASAALVHASDELVGDHLGRGVVRAHDAAHDVRVALDAERSEHDEHRHILNFSRSGRGPGVKAAMRPNLSGPSATAKV